MFMFLLQEIGFSGAQGVLFPPHPLALKCSPECGAELDVGLLTSRKPEACEINSL